nr:MAG TPA: hypothetical protein [Caudoviricetes sp.]
MKKPLKFSLCGTSKWDFPFSLYCIKVFLPFSHYLCHTTPSLKLKYRGIP